MWGNTASDTDPRHYPTALIGQHHPQEAELKAAALFHTHPEQRTRDYKVPIGKAGSEKGKTLISAKVIDTRCRKPNCADTIQVTMEPGEKAGPVIERAQSMLDKASSLLWKPWRNKRSGISCRRPTGEELLPTDTMPTEGEFLLKGATRVRKRVGNGWQRPAPDGKTEQIADRDPNTKMPKVKPAGKKQKHNGDSGSGMTSPELAISASTAAENKRLKKELARLLDSEKRLRDDRDIAIEAVKLALRTKRATRSMSPDHSDDSRSESDDAPQKKGKKGD